MHEKVELICTTESMDKRIWKFPIFPINFITSISDASLSKSLL